MPTYEYACPAGHEFEKFQKMSDRSRVVCPECGRQAERRISGGAGLVFKGSGFYITDYGKDGKGPRKSDKPVEPGKEATSAAKPDAAGSTDASPKSGSKSGAKSPPKP